METSNFCIIFIIYEINFNFRSQLKQETLRFMISRKYTINLNEIKSNCGKTLRFLAKNQLKYEIFEKLLYMKISMEILFLEILKRFYRKFIIFYIPKDKTIFSNQSLRFILPT